jgi:hypothetical protein
VASSGGHNTYSSEHQVAAIGRVSKQINWGGGVPIRRRRAEQQAGQDAQVRDLKAAGCEEVFSEQVSAVAQRDRLKEALRFVRRGDTVVTCRPDRLARSTTDLLRTWINGGIGLIMLSIGGQRIDTHAARPAC